MSVVSQLFVVFLVYLAAEGIAALLPFTFPASVLGMVLLLLLLLTKVLKPAQLKESSDFLLGNMAFLFVPTVVGIMEHLPVLWENILAFIVIIVVTTVLTFAATAYTVTAVIRQQRKLKKKEEHK